MRLLIVLLLFPFALMAFEPLPITPSPVVGYREFSFEDTTIKGSRTLLVWYPVSPLTEGKPSSNSYDLFQVAVNAVPFEAEKKKSVIVISHGQCGQPHELSWLVRGLVHEGFIVLGIQHLDMIDNKPHLNHWLRAQDVTTILDLFANGPMAIYADLNRISMAGYSVGGTTALLLAGAMATKLDQLVPGPEYASFGKNMNLDELMPTFRPEMMSKDWRDKRIKSIFIMAPAWAWIFEAQQLHQLSIPVYIIAGSADELVIARNNATFFAQNIPGAFYQRIPGYVGHYIFISALNEEQRKKADPKGEYSYLFEDQATVDRSWIQYEVLEEASRFFNWSLNAINKSENKPSNKISIGL